MGTMQLILRADRAWAAMEVQEGWRGIGSSREQRGGSLAAHRREEVRTLERGAAEVPFKGAFRRYQAFGGCPLLMAR